MIVRDEPLGRARGEEQRDAGKQARQAAAKR